MWWRLLAGRQSKGLEDVSCEEMDQVLEATFAVGKMYYYSLQQQFLDGLEIIILHG